MKSYSLYIQMSICGGKTQDWNDWKKKPKSGMTLESSTLGVTISRYILSICLVSKCWTLTVDHTHAQYTRSFPFLCSSRIGTTCATMSSLNLVHLSARTLSLTLGTQGSHQNQNAILQNVHSLRMKKSYKKVNILLSAAITLLFSHHG